MSNEILDSLLKDYEQKKLNAELDLEKRKEKLYSEVPRLQKIEDDLNNFAIMTAKSILKDSTFSINYSCKICNDTGYIKTNNYKTQMCNCLKQKLLNYSFNKSNIYNLDKENFNNFNENIFSDDVDLSKYRFNISPRKNMINIKNKCIDFISNFDDINQKNLLFTGGTGLR